VRYTGDAVAHSNSYNEAKGFIRTSLFLGRVVNDGRTTTLPLASHIE